MQNTNIKGRQYYQNRKVYSDGGTAGSRYNSGEMTGRVPDEYPKTAKEQYYDGDGEWKKSSA